MSNVASPDLNLNVEWQPHVLVLALSGSDHHPASRALPDESEVHRVMSGLLDPIVGIQIIPSSQSQGPCVCVTSRQPISTEQRAHCETLVFRFNGDDWRVCPDGSVLDRYRPLCAFEDIGHLPVCHWSEEINDALSGAEAETANQNRDHVPSLEPLPRRNLRRSHSTSRSPSPASTISSEARALSLSPSASECSLASTSGTTAESHDYDSPTRASKRMRTSELTNDSSFGIDAAKIPLPPSPPRSPSPFSLGSPSLTPPSQNSLGLVLGALSDARSRCDGEPNDRKASTAARPPRRSAAGSPRASPVPARKPRYLPLFTIGFPLPPQSIVPAESSSGSEETCSTSNFTSPYSVSKAASEKPIVLPSSATNRASHPDIGDLYRKAPLRELVSETEFMRAFRVFTKFLLANDWNFVASSVQWAKFAQKHFRRVFGMMQGYWTFQDDGPFEFKSSTSDSKFLKEEGVWEVMKVYDGFFRTTHGGAVRSTYEFRRKELAAIRARRGVEA